MSDQRSTAPTLPQQCLAEACGTFLLVFFGCGVVHTAVLTGAQVGLWQVAIVWGIGIMLAIFVTGGISGAHLNPAVTVALAVGKRCRWGQVGPYIAAQVFGGFLAAAVLCAIFNPWLVKREREYQVVRGQPGSEVTAMCYGEYFPNPGGLAKPYSVAEHEALNQLLSEPIACLIEFIGTAILGLVIFATTDVRNVNRPADRFAPVFIGLTVAVLISLLAPLTQACFNPARDFGPRLFASFAGWGSIALPGPRGLGFLTVYILSPIAGAVVGGLLYDKVLRPAMPTPAPTR